MNSQTLGNKITSQVSKDCILLIEDKELRINEITGLLKMDTVHMIDIQLFSGPNFTEPFFSQFQITLVDERGREVISLLDFKYFIVTFTLSVGHIKRFNFHINESYKGCIKTMDFVAQSLINQFSAMLPMTTSQICYVDTESSQANRRCCKMNENYGFNDGCDEDQYQHGTFGFLSLPHLRTCFVLGAFLFIFIFFFILWAEHDEHVSHETLKTYYRLTEKTTSILSFVRFTIWEDYGESVSIIRRFVFVTFFFCVYFLFFQPLLKQTWVDVIFIIWGVLLYVLPSIVVFNLSIFEHPHPTPKWLLSVVEFIKYDTDGIGQCHHTGCIGLKKLICLPFNIECWKETLKRVTKFGKCTEEEMESSMTKDILNYCLCLIAPIICFPYIVAVFTIIILLIIVTLLAKPYFVLKNSKSAGHNFTEILYSIVYLFILIIPSLILMGTIMLLTLLPFFTGLLCNITYFIPYITVILVSFYYLVQFWESCNSKYSALKMFIYKEYQERKPKKGVKELELAVANEELKIVETKFKAAEIEYTAVARILEVVKYEANQCGATTNEQYATTSGQLAATIGRDARENGRNARENGRDAKENGRGVRENGRDVRGNGRSARGNRGGVRGNGRVARGNGGSVRGNGRGARGNGWRDKKFIQSRKNLTAAHNKFVKAKKELVAAIKTLADKNKTLANTNLELANENLKLAQKRNKSADVDMQNAKKEVETVKEKVKSASKDVTSASAKVKCTKAHVERAINDVKRIKEEVEKNISDVQERTSDKESCISDMEKGTSGVDFADQRKSLIQDIQEADAISKLCSTLNDLNTKIRTTADDQFAIANVLHLSLSQKGHIVPVISKKIYHKVQERILPYDTNLFGLIMKSLFIVLFTYFCIEYVLRRQESNFTDIVKVLTTMSISVLPYFFNVLLPTLSNEHEEEAWNEMIRVNVKHLVDEIELDKGQKLDKSILILQRYTCNVKKKNEESEQTEGSQQLTQRTDSTHSNAAYTAIPMGD